jgi:hypothetical protein
MTVFDSFMVLEVFEVLLFYGHSIIRRNYKIILVEYRCFRKSLGVPLDLMTHAFSTCRCLALGLIGGVQGDMFRGGTLIGHLDGANKGSTSTRASKLKK